MTDDALLELAGVQVSKEDTPVLRVRYCKRCNEMLSPNHDYCIRCGYSDKDVTEGNNVSNELVERINRLESILARLASRFDTDNDGGAEDANSKRKGGKKGNSLSNSSSSSST